MSFRCGESNSGLEALQCFYLRLQFNHEHVDLLPSFGGPLCRWKPSENDVQRGVSTAARQTHRPVAQGPRNDMGRVCEEARC
ncbi:hypothetical protein L596_030570 [Steinernema carpocapsae]|uniref:Uncharacterized protein n=1 Tax=Steinernema carpocapsae TaxID=34508 RepID=A0A4U5LPU4_STECR|nr:hypothetical protein L596_030570 [Steinernema carpocapsae]